MEVVGTKVVIIEGSAGTDEEAREVLGIEAIRSARKDADMKGVSFN
jgi:hypothetical protein